MSDYLNFVVGEKFPLPIQNQGQGGLFQADANGLLFILQLARLDVIATEAFRTGKMEFALCEEDGLLFLLYQIDGIFKEGWGDAPLALHTLKPEHRPTEKSLADPCLHLYLVDSTLQLLCAQRDIVLDAPFIEAIRRHVAARQADPLEPAAYMRRLQGIYAKYPNDTLMRKNAIAVQTVPLEITPLPGMPAAKKH